MGSTKIKRNHTKRRQHNKQKQQTKRNSKKKNAKSRKNRMIGGNIRTIEYDDSTYHGEILPKINKPHGTGIMTWKNGDQYIGSWKDGKRSGLGTMYWRADGTSHYGFWEDDKRHGEGRTTNTKGVVLQGNWENDNPKDRFTARWPDEVEGLEQVINFDAEDFNKYIMFHYDYMSDDGTKYVPTDDDEDDDDDGDEDVNEEVENEQ